MADDIKAHKSSAVSRALIVIGSLVFAALVAVIVVLVMLLNRGEPEPERVDDRPQQRSTLITEESMEEAVQGVLNTPPVDAPESYEVSMTMDWVFPDSASPSPNAYVENVAENETPVYFDLLLRETQEVIYRSPVIPLGERLTNITLDENLNAGTYPCIVEYHLVDENQNTLATVNMGVTITVEN